MLRTKKRSQEYTFAPAEVIGDVGEILCNQHAEEKMKSLKVLLAVLGNIRYFARQALPLRGNWNLETGSEENSNVYQLLKLRAEENSEFWTGQGAKTINTPLQSFKMKYWRQVSARVVSVSIFCFFILYLNGFYRV